MSLFEQFDSGFFVAPSPGLANLPVIPNGYYSLSLPDGSHRTFKIHTKRASAKFAPGQRILSLLIGPQNTEDYEAFAFVDDSGIHVWKRFRGTRQESHANILWLLATGCEADGYSLEISKRCLKCGRVLTDPESIRLGIGPTCRS